MGSYDARIVDLELDQLFSALPAISLDGPKGVGKTATAQQRAATTFALDDPAQRELLLADPGRLNTAPSPVLLDEWQRMPQSWDLVRREVDRAPTAARFLLTGSASPVEAPTHSGAGRIVRLRMHPMTLAERGIQKPTVSLRNLFDDRDGRIDGHTETGLRRYAEEIVASGFPGIRHLPDRGRRAQLDGYIDGIVEHDFAEQGVRVRRPQTLRAWLAAYAAATSTTASYNAILDAATAGEAGKPARTTTTVFRDTLARLWLLEPLPGWLPASNAFTRLAQAPKHHLTDPALTARLLGLDVRSLLTNDAVPTVQGNGSFLGALFESLVALQVRVFSQAAEARPHHLRTRNGDHEVDFILQKADQRVVALEVKLGAGVSEADVRHLKWLRERLGDDLVTGAVINTGPYAYRRPDGIAVIPAALLGP